jgi:uncharacterized Fe-S cluster-containing radical SAM superfamily protein
MKNKEYTINKLEQINLELFGGCNLACPMCPQGIEGGREKDFKRVITESLFYKIIDEALPLGLKFVNLSGSGEPTLSKNLEKFTSYLSSKGITTMIYTNGQLLTPKKFESLCQAGLSIIKVSCMGWDRESYKHWMSIDSFEKVRDSLQKCLEIIKKRNYKTQLQTNHLIQDYQLNMYLKNWVNYLNIKSEIWLAHNWSGVYSEDAASRHKDFKTRKLRSCGRPLANIIEIRAGGIGKASGAVVPCPNVLGKESKSVMGHLNENSLLEVVNGKKYKDLRKKHIEGKFNDLDYCKDCDHLIDVPESLVWTNIEGRKYGGSRISNINYLDLEKNHSLSID